MIIPTNLVCVLFDPVVLTLSFNFIVLYTCYRSVPGKRPCTAFQGVTIAASMQIYGILIPGKCPLRAPQYYSIQLEHAQFVYVSEVDNGQL